MALNPIIWRWNVGTCLEINGINPWHEDIIRKDVEIIGHTDLAELDAIGIDYYKMWYANKGKDELFTAHKENGLPIFIAKGIQRSPYEINKEEITDETRTTFFYFDENLLDLNNTHILTRRTNLEANLNFGNFDSRRIKDPFLREIERKMIDVTDDYTNKGYVRGYTKLTTLVTEMDAKIEDQEFADRVAAEEAAEQEAIKQEQEKLQALINRENFVRQKEARLVYLEKELRESALELEQRIEFNKQWESNLNKLQDELDVRAIMLADREFKLNRAKQIVNDREILLGLPITDWDSILPILFIVGDL